MAWTFTDLNPADYVLSVSVHGLYAVCQIDVIV